MSGQKAGKAGSDRAKSNQSGQTRIVKKVSVINLGKRKKKGNFALTFSGCSSVRFRVRVWGAWGRKFESSHPDIERETVIEFW